MIISSIAISLPTGLEVRVRISRITVLLLPVFNDPSNFLQSLAPVFSVTSPEVLEAITVPEVVKRLIFILGRPTLR